MICPKCGANNAKDPLQCIRCGYIFPEYIEKHDIDMTRTGAKKTEEQKRLEAIQRFNAKQSANNGRRPSEQPVNNVPRQNINVSPRPVQTMQPVQTQPNKIKKIHFIGRNGINRADDIVECLITTIEFSAILGVIYAIVIFLQFRQ